MKRTFVKFAVAGGLAVGMASGAAQAAGGPTDQDILKDAETPGDVLTYGMTVAVTEHLWIPLADGTRLGARLWLPDSAASTPVSAPSGSAL